MTLPDCMMPDGADPCAGYRALAARVRELEAAYAAKMKETVYVANERDALRAENERLRGLLQELVDALREEARTTLAANVATENFTTPDREIDAMSLAMVRALAAMKAAKDALAAGGKTP